MSDLVKFLSKILLACLLVIAVGWATYIGVRYYHAEQVAYRWISGLAAKQALWATGSPLSTASATALS